MSFSVEVVGADKADARQKLESQLDNVIEGQPVHARDKDAVLATFDAYAALVEDNADMDIGVHCHGSVMWELGAPATAETALLGVNVGLNVFQKGRVA